MIDYEAIKSQVNIEDVLTKYGVRINQKGIGLCPLHSERTPSFSVNRKKGLWQCFGCHTGGSVIDLVAKVERITPGEAARKLSEDFRITEEDRTSAYARQTLRNIERYRVQRTESKESLYVDRPEIHGLEDGYRGLSREAIGHWQLGRCSSGVFIPNFSINGSLVSYSIRTEQLPKYLNSKGTARAVPFGLYLNKSDIISNGFTYIVEGQFDAIKMWDAGHRNVVALMGSAITEPQAHLLLAVTTNLTLVLDGDTAGRLGAAKIKKEWGGVFNIDIVYLPEGEDPAVFVERKELAV